jgi:hypothetical protein
MLRATKVVEGLTHGKHMLRTFTGAISTPRLTVHPCHTRTHARMRSLSLFLARALSRFRASTAWHGCRRVCGSSCWARTMRASAGSSTTRRTRCIAMQSSCEYPSVSLKHLPKSTCRAGR